MKLIEFSTRRPVSIFIFSVAAVVFGLVALQRLATDLLPDITYPSLTVRTDYDGAAPLEIEGLVTRPIENAVGVVSGIVRVVSSSRPDVSEVTLEFGWGTNMDLAGLDVRERLDLLQLPVDSERPVLLRFDPSLDPILRVGLSGPEDLGAMRRIAEDEIQRTLERLDGVAAVVVSGGLEEEIQVQLDERMLANLGLTVEQVSARLAQENINLTGGRLREGQTEYLVRTVNEFIRAEDLMGVVVDSSRGANIRVQDFALVVRGHKEREIITRIDGQESVEVAVFKEGGTNSVRVSDTVSESLDELRERVQQIDPSLKLTIITDQAGYIRQSIDSVVQTALLGGLLATIVLYLFLRNWKTTMIIAIAIPISVIASFFLMYVSGISLNVMSLGGLTLGIGLLVDNSIVVLESIHRKREQGLDELDAALAGTSEVARAVIASTLTTICVFVPIVFVEGVAGQLFGDQAMTVTYSLSISLVVSLTLIPMLVSRKFQFEAATRPLDDSAAPTNRRSVWMSKAAFIVMVGLSRTIKFVVLVVAHGFRALFYLPLIVFDAGLGVLTRVYARLLDGVLRFPASTVMIALVSFGASLWLFPGLGRELIPEMVQGEFFVNAEYPPGTNLTVTERRLASIQRATSAIDGVALVYQIAGTSNEQGGVAGKRRENIGQLTVRINEPITREREEAVIAKVRDQLDRDKDLRYRFGRPSYFSFKTPIEIEIRGYNLTLLQRLSDQLVALMHEIDGLADIRSSTEGGTPELQIDFDRARMASLGLGVGDVSETIRSKVLGTVATNIHRDDRTIDIRLRADEGFRDSVKDLGQLTVMQSGKTAIPLSAVATIVEAIGPAEIRRAEGDRVAEITANLVGRDLGSVSEEIRVAMESLVLPSGFDWRIGGQREEMQTSFDSMRTAILLAVFMVYLVMASQFESLVHPFVIMFSVPFSIIGVLVTLSVFDITISIVVLIGVILLAGIVVNNAIILVDYTNQQRRQGSDTIEALKRAGRVRLRPILMTTATTVLGLAPMAFGFGEGSELRAPMAITVMGGLIASTALTLLIIPAVYRLAEKGTDLFFARK